MIPSSKTGLWEILALIDKGMSEICSIKRRTVSTAEALLGELLKGRAVVQWGLFLLDPHTCSERDLY